MKEQYKEAYDLIELIRIKLEKELKLDLSSDEYNNFLSYLESLNIKIWNDINQGVLYE